MTKAVFLKKLSSNIARIRSEHGLSQVELAVRCGKNKQAINRIEKGGHNPSAYILYNIAQVLKVPVNELMEF